MELHKTPLPAKRQVILGCLYDSMTRKVRTAEKKRKKYIKRITDLLKTSTTTVTILQKLHGNLNYAAESLTQRAEVTNFKACFKY